MAPQPQSCTLRRRPGGRPGAGGGGGIREFADDEDGLCPSPALVATSGNGIVVGAIAGNRGTEDRPVDLIRSMGPPDKAQGSDSLGTNANRLWPKLLLTRALPTRPPACPSS